MPHLFGQTRFSKRGDSNSINMRRLQESDSLSENETAPEPPPRPDSVTHVEPPPLPPKKQFNEIVIRPRISSGSALPPSNSISNSRYEFVNSASKMAANTRLANVGGDVPPIPLPSRRVGRSDGAYPGPGRPRKPGHTEDDYLAPISSCVSGGSSGITDVPPLLPPPLQSSARARPQRQQSQTKTQDIYENKSEILQQQQQLQQNQKRDEDKCASAIIPDITLSQLLTLGIDDLSAKLNVPTSQLSIMTLVELTTYLSEFIERSKPMSSPGVARKSHTASPSANQIETRQPPIFKVNFDQQTTFVANFDDTFGEELSHNNRQRNQSSFVANFAQFNEPPTVPPLPTKHHTPTVPPADRYAVFREIIDQELQQTDLMGDLTPPGEGEESEGSTVGLEITPRTHEVGTLFDARFDDDDFQSVPKIDTKITEVVAQAKDRYAALRDIILVENLFDQQPSALRKEKNLMEEFSEFNDDFNEDQDLNQIMNERSGPDRIGLVDSRGLPAEPSSSALTIEDDEDDGAESSLDSNEKEGNVAKTADHESIWLNNIKSYKGQLAQDKYEKLSTSTQQLDAEIEGGKIEINGADELTAGSSILTHSKQDNNFLTVAGTSGLSASKDDLEIDDLMQRAISNLSLDSRERISPANSTNASMTVAANKPQPTAIVVSAASATLTTQSQFNDMSTSPIPLQKSPVSASQKRLSPKSPQVSPIPTQLSAVSSLIDSASKQINLDGELSDRNAVKDSWATFDSPKIVDTAAKRTRNNKSTKMTSLHLPPPPPSNTSQNDTAESPCSSDPRDDGWSKSGGVGLNVGGRRWPTKKERQQTSSSSRDLSPWDDEAPDYQKQKRLPVPATMPAPPHTADRHGYYMRHARRMNSCDEDYEYEEEIGSRRDHRKYKQGISRSRDNFDLDSPSYSWYHHPPHHTWSPQDVEQTASMRARNFERSAYERTTYGPPIYDKRGVALVPPGGVAPYERRSGYDKRKFYRDYARPNYDFDEYGGSPQERYRDAGSFDKLKMGRRADYENVYDDSRSPMGYKLRSDYAYERNERRSFDRDSVESFESATRRRRRSFGSGDVYGSLESREDFRERFVGSVGAEKTRSLRKGIKLRATGDIDYEQDSENDFHPQRPRVVATDARSLQRPSQLSSGINSGQARIRKSSGSSPWDGEEPPLPGQKSWKRPSSAADERRLAESRRTAAVLGQTPSGSDGEKDRRFRKKQRARSKENSITATTGGRYGNPMTTAHPRDNYDFIGNDDDEDYAEDDYDEPPTDEDKFERLNRRRHEMHQRMLESERRQHGPNKLSSMPTVAAPKNYHAISRTDLDFEEYEQTPTPRSNTSGASAQNINQPLPAADTKFSFDGGFESDFNQSSPPPAPAGTASSCNSTPALSSITSALTTPATKSSFRFSNDFSEREKMQSYAQNSTSISSLQQFDLDAASSTSPVVIAQQPPLQAVVTQKLRFDDNVKVSQFDDAVFEDDFSKTQFNFEKDAQWSNDTPTANNGTPTSAVVRKHSIRNSKLQQRQDLIRKSESINIFAKKTEDPFEDDEFFKAPSELKDANTDNSAGNNNKFQWDEENNFAKFDENM